MKSIAFIGRRKDLSLVEYTAYYEGQHAPLAARLLEFAGYRRNHAIGAEPLGFATFGEYWSDPQALGAALAGPTGDALREDELRFMDKPRNKAAFAEPLLDGNLTGRLLALLIDGNGDSAALVSDIAKEGGQLDLLSPFDERALPCRALAFVPCGSKVAVSDGWRVLASCLVSRVGQGVAKLPG